MRSRKVSCCYVSNCCLTHITPLRKYDKGRSETHKNLMEKKNRKQMAARMKFEYSLHGSIRNSYVPPTHSRTNKPSLHHIYILYLSYILNWYCTDTEAKHVSVSREILYEKQYGCHRTSNFPSMKEPMRHVCMFRIFLCISYTPSFHTTINNLQVLLFSNIEWT
jgi:hypothetical protein